MGAEGALEPESQQPPWLLVAWDPQKARGEGGRKDSGTKACWRALSTSHGWALLSGAWSSAAHWKHPPPLALLPRDEGRGVGAQSLLLSLTTLGASPRPRGTPGCESCRCPMSPHMAPPSQSRCQPASDTASWVSHGQNTC